MEESTADCSSRCHSSTTRSRYSSTSQNLFVHRFLHHSQFIFHGATSPQPLPGLCPWDFAPGPHKGFRPQTPDNVCELYSYQHLSGQWQSSRPCMNCLNTPYRQSSETDHNGLNVCIEFIRIITIFHVSWYYETNLITRMCNSLCVWVQTWLNQKFSYWIKNLFVNLAYSYDLQWERLMASYISDLIIVHVVT